MPEVIEAATSADPLSALPRIACRATDSTEIKVEGDGEWHARKHGPSKRHQWCKLHIVVDDETLVIRAIEVSGAGVGDAPMLPELLSQIPSSEDIATVTPDGAYDTRKCHDVIAKRGAAAIIPSLKTPNRGSPIPKGPSSETKLCAPASVSGERFGRG